MEAKFILIITIVIFLIIGIICLWGPNKIQNYILKYYSKHENFKKINPFIKWMETESYVFFLRFIGLVLMFIVVFLIFLFMKI